MKLVLLAFELLSLQRFVRFAADRIASAGCGVVSLLFLAHFSLVAQTTSYTYNVSRFAGGGMPPSPVAALSSGFDGARAVAVDLSGNVYFSSGKRWIFRVNVTGVRTLVAGMGTTGYSGDGGPAISAQLNYAEGLAVDGGGNLYVADLMNNRVRKISPTGIISTVAGSGAPYYSGDGGRAVDAAVGGPYDVAVDHAGNLLIASGGCQCIRRVGSDGAIATIAGNGSTGFSGDGGPARSAQFSQPRRIALDNSGNIYVSDAANHRIRRISSNGVITTIAGNGVQGSSGDGGPASGDT